MPKNEPPPLNRTALAEAFAPAYNKKEAIERLCQQAGVPLEYVNLGAPPIDTWTTLGRHPKITDEHLQSLLDAALADKSKSAFHDGLSKAAERAVRAGTAQKQDPHRFLCCDRAETWEFLMGSAADPRLHLMLLCCTQSDGHGYLFRRILRYRAELNAQTIGLRPEIYDLSPGDFPLMLRDTTHLGLDHPGWEEALNDCSESGLFALLAEITRQKPLILLYPPANPERHTGWLLEHDGQVLPKQYQRIANTRSAGSGLLCIQPVLWQPRPWEKWVKRFTADSAAHDILKPVLALSQDQSLIHLCHLESMGEKHVRSFFQRIFAGNPRQIEAQFSRIEPLLIQNASPQDIFKELERIWIE